MIELFYTNKYNFITVLFSNRKILSYYCHFTINMIITISIIIQIYTLLLFTYPTRLITASHQSSMHHEHINQSTTMFSTTNEHAFKHCQLGNLVPSSHNAFIVN